MWLSIHSPQYRSRRSSPGAPGHPRPARAPPPGVGPPPGPRPPAGDEPETVRRLLRRETELNEPLPQRIGVRWLRRAEAPVAAAPEGRAERAAPGPGRGPEAGVALRAHPAGVPAPLALHP